MPIAAFTGTQSARAVSCRSHTGFRERGSGRARRCRSVATTPSQRRSEPDRRGAFRPNAAPIIRARSQARRSLRPTPGAMAAASGNPRPRVLISNDDGVAAPGLRALVAALRESDCCDIYVCGPSGERSAQSHSINIKTPLEAWDISVPGAVEAYAVEGTPADSVMLALNSDIFKKQPEFDLVVSGINRGENAGYHVIYSGTVGAAREAALKGVRALALSLDLYKATTVDEYAFAARQTVPIIRAMLGMLPLPESADLALLNRAVINVNFPKAAGEHFKGFRMAKQSDHCVLPKFEHLPEGSYQKMVEHDIGGGKLEQKTVRQFRNLGQVPDRPLQEGTDYWAIKQGWAAVTPVGLLSDLQAWPEDASSNQATSALVGQILKAAAEEAAVPCKL